MSNINSVKNLISFLVYFEPLSEKTINALLIVAAALFLISLALPSFETHFTYLTESTRIQEPSQIYNGIDALIYGWFSILYGATKYGSVSIFYGNFAWCANMGIFISFVLIKKESKFCFPVSIVMALLALTSFFHPTIDHNNYGEFYVSKLMNGFYFWLAAIFALCFISYRQKCWSE